MARRPTTLIGTQTNIRFVSLVCARKVPETHTEKILCEIPIDEIVLYVWHKREWWVGSKKPLNLTNGLKESKKQYLNYTQVKQVARQT